MTDRDLAEMRGKRAEKLFKINTPHMDDILAAINKEELHRADPKNPLKPSGKGDFFVACSQAIKKRDDDGIPTDGDVYNFFEDLWNATWGSRGAHESKPCW